MRAVSSSELGVRVGAEDGDEVDGETESGEGVRVVASDTSTYLSDRAFVSAAVGLQK